MGRYVIDRVIGAGGFSRVYKATQMGVDRPVAIKVLDPNISGKRMSEAERERKLMMVAKRFEREAKLISKLRDPNTVVMHDYGQTEDGLLYMVLEYVDGITIGELIRQAGALPAARVAKILGQALSSLQEAHAFGVLHRDIKPANIMVYEHIGRTDQVKVLDFGIAKTVSDQAQKTSTSELTGDGVLVGTPRYMSPEQIRGDVELGPPSDIYSLGLVAYEMISGTKAVEADSSMKIIARHLDPTPIELPRTMFAPPGVINIINRMLEKDLSRRYADCAEVMRDLENWDSNDPSAMMMPHDTFVDPATAPAAITSEHSAGMQPSPPTDTMFLNKGMSSSNKTLLAGIALVMVLIAGMLFYITMVAEDGAQAGEPATAEVPANSADPVDTANPVKEVAAAEPEPTEPTVDAVKQGAPQEDVETDTQIEEPVVAEKPPEEPQPKPKPKKRKRKVKPKKKAVAKPEKKEEDDEKSSGIRLVPLN